MNKSESFLPMLSSSSSLQTTIHMDIMHINSWLLTLVFNWYETFFKTTLLILVNF